MRPLRNRPVTRHNERRQRASSALSVRSLSVKETVKLRTRIALAKRDLSIGRDPASNRLLRTLVALDVRHVIDVGANVGQFATLLRAAGYKGQLLSFEPLPDAFRILQTRARRDNEWSVFNLALGDATRQAKINISSNSYSSSILQVTSAHVAAAPQSVVQERTPVQVDRLDHVLGALHVDLSRTLLKLDTQGYEWQVLDGAGEECLRRLPAVHVEMSTVPLYEGQALFDDLRARLEDAGLTLFSIEPGLADHQGRMLQCDTLFVRTSQLPACS